MVVTLGPEGCLGFMDGRSVRLPGMRVEVVDTIGAGDAFMGGLLAFLHHRGWLPRATLERLTAAEMSEVLTYASRTSALTCTRAGAEPPYRREVDRA